MVLGGLRRTDRLPPQKKIILASEIYRYAPACAESNTTPKKGVYTRRHNNEWLMCFLRVIEVLAVGCKERSARLQITVPVTLGPVASCVPSQSRNSFTCHGHEAASSVVTSVKLPRARRTV